MPCMTWHPWRALSRLPHLTLRWRRTPSHLGSWDASTKTITLHPDQSQAERRCTLTHELIHAERDHHGRQPASVERRVHADAARRLITDEALVDALRWTVQEDELADELWVDVPTVVARLSDLSDEEKVNIYRRLWGDSEGAT
jgi:hypothetical protein